ncbi:hypothetical protein ACFR9U_00355 [Halorientalis brevis]|uniref:Uncharacterized protein n=1 Tax=Halorientalis brevis TaxID=1126241 RepID=A0ABD6C569_9EURY|nr:hypothetical protein [Halorientalis brevis]
MNRRRYLAAIATTTAVLGLHGQRGANATQGDSGRETGTATADGQPGGQTPGQSPTGPAVQSFTGSGPSVERGIEIEGGLTVVSATHAGTSNFVVTLVGEGEFDDLFVNAIGEYEGETAALLEQGSYLLDVDADGDWAVEIRQPRAARGEPLPQSLRGSGPSVSGPFQFTGTHVASATHSGESNFIVEVYPVAGAFAELVVNEIGQFEGESAFRFDGLGWVAVQADGDWTVALE